MKYSCDIIRAFVPDSFCYSVFFLFSFFSILVFLICLFRFDNFETASVICAAFTSLYSVYGIIIETTNRGPIGDKKEEKKENGKQNRHIQYIMYGNFQQISYPTHKSPMDCDTAHRESDWVQAASFDRIYVLKVGEFGVTRQQKLDLLQKIFWPALARWVISRQQILPGGTILGGWWRADMQGMMDWYRECLHMTARWEDAIIAHTDGIWRIALETSPWRDWPEFFLLLNEPVVDGNGQPVRDSNGRIVYKKRDPTTDGMEDAFLDLWEAIANSRPLVGFSNNMTSKDGAMSLGSQTHAAQDLCV
jgi:hypothetical protein